MRKWKCHLNGYSIPTNVSKKPENKNNLEQAATLRPMFFLVLFCEKFHGFVTTPKHSSQQKELLVPTYSPAITHETIRSLAHGVSNKPLLNATSDRISAKIYDYVFVPSNVAGIACHAV